MLVDIDLEGCLVVIAGGGAQALKRAESLQGEGCSILVVGEHIDARISKLGSVTTREQKISDASFVRGCGARIVIAATSDDDLNAAISEAARKEPNCLAYSADGSSRSDYSHVASARLSDSVGFAVSTRGQSPMMAGTLRDRAAVALAGLVTSADEAWIGLYATLRSESKRRVKTPSGRRRFMLAVSKDEGVQQLIKDGKLDAAQERAMAILEKWDNV